MTEEIPQNPPAPVASYRVEQAVAVLTIDSPPVNALGHRVRLAIAEGVERALADGGVQALVLVCAGRTFFAGADVSELGKPILPPLLGDIIALFEASPKPVVAAMHGTALGGGFELALAAHFRVAVAAAAVGLPEVALGLLPGAGGTQRVPRLVGVRAAVEMIGLGRQVKAPEALELGLIDAIVADDALVEGAVAFARAQVAAGARLRRLRDLPTDMGGQEAQAVFAAFRAAHPDLFIGFKAAEGVLQAIEAAATLPFDAGLARERALSQALTASPESAAQRHLFFAARAAARLPGSEKLRAAPAEAVAVIGPWAGAAGLRAAGVAVADAVLPGRPALLGTGARPEAAEGASCLIHTEGAATLPADAIGLMLHAGVAEIVVGQEASPATAVTAMALAQQAGWPAIYVRPAPGLVVARLAGRLQAAMAALAQQGIRPADIAASGRAFGFAAALLPAAEGAGTASAQIEQALVWPVLAEAWALIDEGVALRAADVDFAMVRAGLWPAWKGGPAYMAAEIGRAALAPWRATDAAPATGVDA